MESTLAFTINPFAGEHRITSSAVEIEASRRAAEVSLGEVSYYRERYGERGRLFGQSDGAWLATLCRGDERYVERQVLWLGGVLSSRGMPRWLLERHLGVLHSELLRLHPADAECYALLDDAAWLLRERRQARIAEADARELAEGFTARADATWTARVPEMGRILVAAVADEADGIDNAVPSVESWAGDPARFPPGWRGAVESTIREARLRAGTAGGA